MNNQPSNTSKDSCCNNAKVETQPVVITSAKPPEKPLAPKSKCCCG